MTFISPSLDDTTSERLLRDVAASAPTSLPWEIQRGIVIAAGGLRYLTCAYVAVSRLRTLDCTLPIHIWHVGEGEVDASSRLAFEKLGVTFIDALQIPDAKGHPCLAGWPLKSFALQHCAFREVLFLDADNVPVRNPEYLFDSHAFRQYGALFWPDQQVCQKSNAVWTLTGLPPRDEVEFESGQMLIDRRLCGKALSTADWMNWNSKFWYRHVHGDKDTFRLAWHIAESPFGMIVTPPGVLRDAVLLQHDPDGALVFQHRGGAKWHVAEAPRTIPGFRDETACQDLVKEFRLSRLRSEGQDQALRADLMQYAWIYDIHGWFSRPMEFEEDGSVGIGMGALEVFWSVENGILSFSDRNRNITCRVEIGPDGVYLGRWVTGRCLAVSLAKPANSRRCGMQIRQDTVDAAIIQNVLFENEYRIPDSLHGLTIIDIGAHIGSFSIRCHQAAALRIFAFEADAENFQLLRRNTADFPDIDVCHAAVGRSDGHGGWRCRISSAMEARNSGGKTVLSNAGETTALIPLDQILCDLGYCDLLKLDCEGSEYPILFTSKELHRVHAIVGEYHVVHLKDIDDTMMVAGCDYSIQGIERFLSSLGMQVSWEPRGSDVGLFWAIRRG